MKNSFYLLLLPTVLMLLSGCNRDIREFGKPTITHQITAKANPVFYGPPDEPLLVRCFE